MTSETKAKIAIIIVSLSAAVWAFNLMLPASPVELENTRKDNIKVFCAQGRQWIEFQNGYATWGAMMLDQDGKPVLCNSIIDSKPPKG